MPKETKWCPALMTNIPKLFQQQPQNSCGIFSLCIIWQHEHYYVKRARYHSLRLSGTNYLAPGLRSLLGPFWCSDHPKISISLFTVSERAWRECHRESEQCFWNMIFGVEVCSFVRTDDLPMEACWNRTGELRGTESQTFPFWVEHWHEHFPA